MKKNRDVTSYSKGTMVLHWLIALIVLSMLSLSFFLDDLPKASKPLAYMLHKSFGLTILALMIVRIFWIIRTGKPELPKSIPRWEVILSKAVQHSMYVFLIAMPICGWMASVFGGRVPVYFGLFKLPIPGLSLDKDLSEFFNQCHEVIAWILITLITLHIAGALKHYLIDKDNVLSRMLPK